MASLIQRMYPIAHFCSFNRGQGAGTHTAAGTWTYTASADCAGHVDDVYGSLDETNYAAAVSMGAAGLVNNGQFEWTFGDVPVNITITNLTLVAYLRTSNGASASIDSPPTVEFFVDPGTGVRDYWGDVDTVDSPVNRNTQEATGTFVKFTRNWSGRPAGGAWTRADLLSGSFKAGISSDGTHGSGIDKTSGGSGANGASFDVAAFWIELETMPSGLYLDPTRTVLSHQLRFLSKATRTFTIDVPPQFEDVVPGSTVWASHDLLPWEPGYEQWEEVPLYVIGVTDAIDPPRLTLTCLDLRDVYATYYSPMQILGVDDQNTGLARLDQGGGWATDRDQVAYAERSDDLFQQVAADSPLLDENGLLIQGGSTGGAAQDANLILNSTFNAGTTNAFTSWTVETSGGGVIIEDGWDYFIDSPGFQRSAKLILNASADAAVVKQTVASVPANTSFVVRGWYKNDSGPDAYSLEIQRAADSYYWDNLSTSWTASAAYETVSLETTVEDFRSKHINVGTSTTNVTVRFGRFSGTGTSEGVGHIYGIELLTGDADYYCKRSPLVTTTSGSVTRLADFTTLDNSADFNVWHPSRGYFRLDFQSLWAHSELDDGEIKPILCSAFDSSTSGWLVVAYERVDSTGGIWHFGGAQIATTTSNLTGIRTVQARTRYTLAGRWTGSTADEYSLGGQALDLWVTSHVGIGIIKSTGETGRTEPTQGASSVVYLGHDGTRWADGWIKNLVLSNHCPTDTEMERMLR